MTKEEVEQKVFEIFEMWGYGSNSDKEVCKTKIVNLFVDHASVCLPTDEEIESEFKRRWKDKHGIWAGGNLYVNDVKSWAIILAKWMREYKQSKEK